MTAYINLLIELFYEMTFVYSALINLNDFWNFGFFLLSLILHIVRVSFESLDNYIFCMSLIPLSVDKSDDDTYLQYLFSRDFEAKSISYKDFYDLCGPFLLNRNSYFSVSLLVQPSKGTYIAGEGVYIIISDRDLKSSVSISKSHFYASWSTSCNSLLPSKSFSTALPLVAFAELVAKKEEYLGNSSRDQLQEVVAIAKSLEKTLLYWAEKGVNVFHLSAGFRFFPLEVEEGNVAECKNAIEKFKVFTLHAVTFLVRLSDIFVDRVLDPETAVFYKDRFCDLDLFKSIILSKIKSNNNSYSNGNPTSKKELFLINSINEVKKREFHVSTKNYSPKDNNASKVIQSSYLSLRRLMSPMKVDNLKCKVQEVNNFIASKDVIKSTNTKPSFFSYLDEKNVFVSAKAGSTNGILNTSALAALQASVKDKNNIMHQTDNNQLSISAHELKTMLDGFKPGNVSYLKLFALGVAFEDPQNLSNNVHLMPLSLGSEVTLSTLMAKGPAMIVEFDSFSKMRLKKVLVNGSLKDQNPVLNKAIDHPVILRQGPSGIVITNITGSGNPTWAPNAYYAGQLSKYGIPYYQICRRDAPSFGFSTFGSSTSPYGELHDYRKVNVNLLHHYQPLGEGEQLSFDNKFKSVLGQAELFKFGKRLDCELSSYFDNGTAVAFTEVSRSDNLRLSNDIGGYSSDLLASDGQRAIEQFGLSCNSHKLAVQTIDYDSYLIREKQKLLEQFKDSSTANYNQLAKKLSYEEMWVRTFSVEDFSRYYTLLVYQTLLGKDLSAINMVAIPSEKGDFENFVSKVLPNHPVIPFMHMDEELETLCQLLLKHFNNTLYREFLLNVRSSWQRKY